MHSVSVPESPSARVDNSQRPASVRIDVLRGGEAAALLRSSSFSAEWSALCKQCPWSTAFQSPGFANAWYNSYRTRYEPLLVIHRTTDGTVQGLLALAKSVNGKELVVVGAAQAEYHAWICTPELSQIFPWMAFRALRKETPSSGLKFRYIPRGTPLEWVNSRQAVRHCLLKSFSRPLLQLGDGEDVRSSLKKGSNKSRIKRLEKMGGLEFKKITDAAEFDSMFDAMIRFYDLRHGAVHGSADFDKDPLKKPFHLAMMRVPGLLHVTAMKVGGELVAAHMGVASREELQLGIIVHNPTFSKYSPGKFQILFLCKMLMDEGCNQLDLTPGGDPYKERFANAWDEVHTLAVFPTPHHQRRATHLREIETMERAILKKFAISTRDAVRITQKIKETRPRDLPAIITRKTKAWIGSEQQALIYTRKMAEVPLTSGPELIRRDAFEDILAYQPERFGMTRRDFLSDSLRRLEEGQHIYTYAEYGKLLHYAWLVDRAEEELMNQVLPGLILPADSALILDWRTFPEARKRGLATRSLQRMLRDARTVNGIEQTFIQIWHDSYDAQRIIEKYGFVQSHSVLRKTKFGRSQTWVMPK
jgi:CelD/BcsL family acetyltransferase involved in cellulose biosynthesis/RimJ/RimL family protein N-acetyltransferase